MDSECAEYRDQNGWLTQHPHWPKSVNSTRFCSQEVVRYPSFVSHQDASLGIDISAFLGGKTSLARALVRGECGGRYEDAILILSSVVGTFAAQFWPRQERSRSFSKSQNAMRAKSSLDSKRFVEFWVTYADAALGAKKISVPLLAEAMHERKNTSALAGLRSLRPAILRQFPEEVDGNVCTGETADASEEQVVDVCPGLTLADIRWWSYPAVFYREVRSGYVHQLNPTEQASHFPGGKSSAPVSYRNCMSRPFRRIYFEAGWLCEVVESMALSAYPDWQRDSSRCAIQWWIDGA